MYNMYNDLSYVMISKDEIQAKVAEIAQKLDEIYGDTYPVMVGILKGSTPFFADLIRAMKIPVQIDFMAASSYGNASKSSGFINIKKDLDADISGRHVVLVEDIMDSGRTLSHLKEILADRNALSVKVCALLDKPSRREMDITPDFKGFEIENEFVVGYGLDYAEKYRNLPEIGVLKPELYSK